MNKSDHDVIIWYKDEKPSTQELEKIIEAYETGSELKRLNNYEQYYDACNTKIINRVERRAQKSISPNELLISSYYKTVVDTMSGFMFSNVTYTPSDEDSEEYAFWLNNVLEENDVDVKDMAAGINSLAFNKGVEWVYTKATESDAFEIRFAEIKPQAMILVYSNDIESELLFGIRMVKSFDPEYDFEVDVIYKDEWVKYYRKGGTLTEKEGGRTDLYYSECPVIDFRTEVVNITSPFDQIITYIDALDMLLTSNTNDISKLADAILKLSMQLTEEDKKDLDAIKVIDQMSKEDIAEYITKDMSPDFRQYVSKLFIKEIHKHSHTIDWFDSENVSGDASGRALRIRLFDMNMYSKRLEKVFIKGLRKRVDLIGEVFEKSTGMQAGNITITLNRELPDNFIDLAPILAQVGFMDDISKLEALGYSQEEIDQIIKRKDDQTKRQVDLFESRSKTTDTDVGEPGDEPIEE
jgi:SPP1 family phage portal protein